MKRAKRRHFSGVMCEQICYSVPDSTVNIKGSQPRPRFKDEAERVAHKLNISRGRFTRLVNENFTPSSLYITFTLDNEWEVHTFEEAVVLMVRYVRRLLSRYPDARLVWVKGRGKATGRIHYHMIVDGVPEDVLQSQWGYGSVVRCVHLKAHNYYEVEGQGLVDHGADYTGLANYLFDHWTPEQGGHRWRYAGKLRRPEPEPATECKRVYSLKKPPQAPKGYILVQAKATQFGYLYFKYIKKPEPDRRRRSRTSTAQKME